MAKAFIAVYTNQCKQYCDDKFFPAIQNLSYPDKEIHVVDNSLGLDYIGRLSRLCPGAMIEHIEVNREPKLNLFQRNVFHSVDRLRTLFLASGGEYFIVVESDVLPPMNLVELFEEVIDQADIIGGIYYTGFHTADAFKPDNLQLETVKHVLSGCTLYKREVIEKIPFRWDPELLAAFPDAFMSFDAAKAGYRLANYNKIKCQHLHAPNGYRGLELLQ